MTKLIKCGVEVEMRLGKRNAERAPEETWINRSLLFYESENGNSPIRDFLNEIAPAAAAKIQRCLIRIRSEKIVSAKIWKKLKSTNLWEVRTEHMGMAFRILCFTHHSTIVLLHGFAKKSQATPRSDLEVAEQRLKHYLQRAGKL